MGVIRAAIEFVTKPLKHLAAGTAGMDGAPWTASVRAFFLGYHSQILDSIALTAKMAKSGIE